jgi:hypothetical protein
MHYAQGDDDAIIITDSEEDYPHTQEPVPSKRKVRDDPKSLRPTKRQTVWVEVPPRSKRVALVSTKQGPPRTDQAIDTKASAPPVKRELEQEESDALSTIRNVWGPSFPPRICVADIAPIFLIDDTQAR